MPDNRLKLIGRGLGKVNFRQSELIEGDGVYWDASANSGDGSWIRSPRYLLKNEAAHTLTSTTNAQTIFAAETTLTMEEGSYLFACQFRISGLSSTSGNASFSILGSGTATLTRQNWHWIGTDLTADTTTIFTPDMGWSNTSDTTSVGTSMFTAGTGTRMNAYCWGHFRVSTAGTVIPEITLVTAAAGTVNNGAYFYAQRISDGTDTFLGDAS